MASLNDATDFLLADRNGRNYKCPSAILAKQTGPQGSLQLPHTGTRDDAAPSGSLQFNLDMPGHVVAKGGDGQWRRLRYESTSSSPPSDISYDAPSGVIGFNTAKNLRINAELTLYGMAVQFLVYGDTLITSRAVIRGAAIGPPGAPVQRLGSANWFLPVQDGMNFGGSREGYSLAASLLGSGGQRGALNNGPNVPGVSNTSAGGRAGGSFLIRCLGDVIIEDGAQFLLSGGDGTAPFAAGGMENWCGGGGGGGSGGTLILHAEGSIAAGAGVVIDVRGGNGSDGRRGSDVTQEARAAGGGGGGSGGIVVLQAGGVSALNVAPLLTGGRKGNNYSVSGGSATDFLAGGSGGGFARAGGPGQSNTVGPLDGELGLYYNAGSPL